MNDDLIINSFDELKARWTAPFAMARCYLSRQIT